MHGSTPTVYKFISSTPSQPSIVYVFELLMQPQSLQPVKFCFVSLDDFPPQNRRTPKKGRWGGG